MISCGLDEAGRGAAIGPLVIACVVVDEAGRKQLKEIGVRDSKQLSSSRREELAKLITEICLEQKLLLLEPWEIDRLREHFSLNAIEAAKMAELLESLERKPEVVFVDSPDPDPRKWGRSLESCLRSIKPRIIAAVKADQKFVEVSAASIIAKVERDEAIEKIKEECGEDFGSGYPSDELTMRFIERLIRKRRELPPFVRRSWDTIDKAKQLRLPEF